MEGAGLWVPQNARGQVGANYGSQRRTRRALMAPQKLSSCLTEETPYIYARRGFHSVEAAQYGGRAEVSLSPETAGRPDGGDGPLGAPKRMRPSGSKPWFPTQDKARLDGAADASFLSHCAP